MVWGLVFEPHNFKYHIYVVMTSKFLLQAWKSALNTIFVYPTVSSTDPLRCQLNTSNLACLKLRSSFHNPISPSLAHLYIFHLLWPKTLDSPFYPRSLTHSTGNLSANPNGLTYKTVESNSTTSHHLHCYHPGLSHYHLSSG